MADYSRPKCFNQVLLPPGPTPSLIMAQASQGLRVLEGVVDLPVQRHIGCARHQTFGVDEAEEAQGLLILGHDAVSEGGLGAYTSEPCWW